MRLLFSRLLSAGIITILAAGIYGCEAGNIDFNQTGNTEETPSEDGNEGEEEPQGPESPAPGFYSVVTARLQEWDGDYLITYTDENSIKVFNAWEPYGQSTVDLASAMTENGIPTEEGDKYKAVIRKEGNGYTIYVSGIGYIGYADTGNSLTRTEKPSTGTDLWDISFSDAICLSPMNARERKLLWNNSAPRFACYKSALEDITLYRRDISGAEENPGTGQEPGTGPDTEPGTDSEDGTEPEPGTDDIGWYELPAITDKDKDGIIDTDNTLYYAYHLCAGPETYGHNGRKARNYTVCYSAEHHCPVWVAAPRHEMYEHGADRTDAYGKDPDIPADIQYNSKETGGGCNKGHMLGSAERISSSATNRQVFYYTNIAPQLSSTFNTGGGAWNNLEDYVDNLVCSDTLYEVVGCYFEKYTDAYGKSCEPVTISFGGRNDVTRPAMFYYALLRTKDGNSGKAVTECLSSELQCVAFVVRHNMEKGHKPGRNDMISVSDLEKLTGFRYFANVPNAPKDSFNASDWGL